MFIVFEFDFTDATLVLWGVGTDFNSAADDADKWYELLHDRHLVSAVVTFTGSFEKGQLYAVPCTERLFKEATDLGNEAKFTLDQTSAGWTADLIREQIVPETEAFITAGSKMFIHGTDQSGMRWTKEVILKDDLSVVVKGEGDVWVASKVYIDLL